MGWGGAGLGEIFARLFGANERSSRGGREEGAGRVRVKMGVGRTTHKGGVGG